MLSREEFIKTGILGLAATAIIHTPANAEVIQNSINPIFRYELSSKTFKEVQLELEDLKVGSEQGKFFLEFHLKTKKYKFSFDLTSCKFDNETLCIGNSGTKDENIKATLQYSAMQERLSVTFSSVDNEILAFSTNVNLTELISSIPATISNLKDIANIIDANSIQLFFMSNTESLQAHSDIASSNGETKASTNENQWDNYYRLCETLHSVKNGGDDSTKPFKLEDLSKIINVDFFDKDGFFFASAGTFPRYIFVAHTFDITYNAYKIIRMTLASLIDYTEYSGEYANKYFQMMATYMITVMYDTSTKLVYVTSPDVGMIINTIELGLGLVAEEDKECIFTRTTCHYTLRDSNNSYNSFTEMVGLGLALISKDIYSITESVIDIIVNAAGFTTETFNTQITLYEDSYRKQLERYKDKTIRTIGIDTHGNGTMKYADDRVVLIGTIRMPESNHRLQISSDCKYWARVDNPNQV